MHYKSDWENTRQKFEKWWKNENSGRPLMKIVAQREPPSEPLFPETPWATPEAFHLDIEENSKRYHNYCRSNRFLAEAFPSLDLNIGPGSLALYLGTEPDFHWDTIWFREWIEDWEEVKPFVFDPANPWLCRHLALIERARALSGDQYLINIPDIVENIDILAAMRGPQDLCYDLFDSPEEIHNRLDQLDRIYFEYYDRFYELVKMPDNSSSFTAFGIWGEGKTGKVQCDFCALMSPTQFREYIQPSLALQCAGLNHSMYHLDGPDAIKHLDALLEIDDLQVIQWTNGAGNPDGLNPMWYEPIYEKVAKAGKSLLMFVEDGGVKDWIAGIDRYVDRFSTKGLYMHFPPLNERDAEYLLETAEKRWGGIC